MSAASQKNNEERQKKYNKKIDFPELTIFSASLGKKGGAKWSLGSRLRLHKVYINWISKHGSEMDTLDEIMSKLFWYRKVILVRKSFADGLERSLFL